MRLFCETSFKIEVLKLKNKAFLRNFLQKQSFENQKRSFFARLPSKLKFWGSKTKLFCESSFKNDVFATLTNSCACRVFCNVSKSLRLPREKHFEPPKTTRNRQFLTILTFKSLSSAGVVQILRSATSKSAPNPRYFNDFDFQIALARKRGAIFAELNFQKCSEPANF